MSEQSNNSGGQAPSNQKRNNNRRRHYNKGPRNNANKENAQGQNSTSAPQNPNQQKRPQHNHHNRPQRPQDNQGNNIERLYEKYLNLLDQHLIARRKYHDLFFRADPAQKIKLEKNFYNTVNEVREFENRMSPETRALFEKRNNGLKPDIIYATNHELPLEAAPVSDDLVIEDPHLLQSQINCDFSGDTEESVGEAEDYLKYKGL